MSAKGGSASGGKKNENKKNTLAYFVVTAMIASAAVFGWPARADDVSSASDTQDKIDELQKKADIYKQIIDIKQKQTATLNDQLSLIDSNVKQLQSQIKTNKQQLDDLNNQIIRMQGQVDEKKTIIAGQRSILAQLIQSYYENDRKDVPDIFFGDRSLSFFMSSKDQLSQTSSKISDLLDSVTQLKKGMESQITDLSDKKSKVIDLSNSLDSQNNDLQATIQSKQTLLSQTQGEEARYQQMLAKVEQEKQQLLDIDQFFASSGLKISDYPTPPAALDASTSWYYSQTDPRWGNSTIGNTRTLMKSYGCAVTAVAMVLTEHGSSITPGSLAKQSIFSGDLINWPDSWSGSKIVLSSDGNSHGNINWSTIDAQIAKGNPVIVHINRSVDGQGHYVVLHHKEAATGKYVAHDPYFGANIYLDTSRALIGAMGKSSATSIDQMIIYK